MKTRKELIKELPRYETKEGEVILPSAVAEYERTYKSTAYPIYDVDQVKQILDAPTEKQMKCSFCHPEYPNMKYQGFKYCPHCARKLGEKKND